MYDSSSQFACQLIEAGRQKFVVLRFKGENLETVEAYNVTTRDIELSAPSIEIDATLEAGPRPGTSTLKLVHKPTSKLYHLVAPITTIETIFKVLRVISGDSPESLKKFPSSRRLSINELEEKVSKEGLTPLTVRSRVRQLNTRNRSNTSSSASKQSSPGSGEMNIQEPQATQPSQSRSPTDSGNGVERSVRTNLEHRMTADDQSMDSLTSHPLSARDRRSPVSTSVKKSPKNASTSIRRRTVTLDALRAESENDNRPLYSILNPLVLGPKSDKLSKIPRASSGDQDEPEETNFNLGRRRQQANGTSPKTPERAIRAIDGRRRPQFDGEEHLLALRKAAEAARSLVDDRTQRGVGKLTTPVVRKLSAEGEALTKQIKEATQAQGFKSTPDQPEECADSTSSGGVGDLHMLQIQQQLVQSLSQCDRLLKAQAALSEENAELRDQLAKTSSTTPHSPLSGGDGPRSARGSRRTSFHGTATPPSVHSIEEEAVEPLMQQIQCLLREKSALKNQNEQLDRHAQDQQERLEFLENVHDTLVSTFNDEITRVGEQLRKRTREVMQLQRELQDVQAGCWSKDVPHEASQLILMQKYFFAWRDRADCSTDSPIDQSPAESTAATGSKVATNDHMMSVVASNVFSLEILLQPIMILLHFFVVFWRISFTKAIKPHQIVPLKEPQKNEKSD